MIYKKVFVLSCCLLTLLSCEKKDIPPVETPDPQPNPGKLELVWQSPLTPDTAETESFDPLVYDNSVVFSAGIQAFGTTALRSFKSSNGEVNWTTPVSNGAGSRDTWQHLIAVNSGKRTHVVDLNNGSVLWNSEVESARNRIRIVGKYVYHQHKPSSSGIHYPFVHMVRSPVAQERWDTLFTLYADSLDGYRPGIESPDLWMTPGSDSVLVFQNRSWHFGNSDGRIDFYAYNLSQQKVEFVLEDIEPNGNSNVFPPLVDGDYCYFMGSRQLYCIDLVQQKILWTKQYLGSLHHIMLSNIIVDGNRLFLKADDGALFCYDKISGNTIWEHTEGAGATDSYMELHDGILYYTADGEGKLFAVDSRNGEIIWAENSPNEGKYPAGFNGGVAIDPERGYIYAADWYFAMCFKLPEL